MVYEVLEQRWAKFEQAMKNVTNFDQILQLHNDFLNDCIKETLLLDQQLLKILSKINGACYIFSKSIQNFTENMKVNEQTPVKKRKNKY